MKKKYTYTNFYDNYLFRLKIIAESCNTQTQVDNFCLWVDRISEDLFNKCIDLISKDDSWDAHMNYGLYVNKFFTYMSDIKIIATNHYKRIESCTEK